METSNTEGITKIHNVRFYNLSPRSIVCLAYNNLSNKLAVSRNDGTLEIWDFKYAPILEKFLLDDEEQPIQSLGWCGNRLFSCAFKDVITEWDLVHLKPKHITAVTAGNKVWCLDISRQEDSIAFGTDQGYLNLYEIVEDGIMHKMFFDKQDGRILCCKFDATGDFIVTGSIDVIRIWSTKTGNAIHKLTMGRMEAKRETYVWSIQIVSEFSIISGDSRGYVTVWDGKLGTQIQSMQVSKADIFTLAVNEDENTLMVSGSDSLIRIYSLTQIRKEDFITQMWVKFLQRNIHSHDVLAVVCVGNKIISGGSDGYIGISSYSKVGSQEISKYGPFLQNPCSNVSTQERLILLRYTKYLELWKLGLAENKVQINEDENDPTKFLILEEGPEKLIELRSFNDDVIICSSVSPDGCFLIYSTNDSIRMFSLRKCNKNEKVDLVKIKHLPENFSPSIKVLFSSDSKSLFLVKANCHIDVFDIDSNNEINYIETINASKSIKDVINFITISVCGKYLIAAGTCRIISVWHKKSKGRWQHYLNLPKYKAPTCAIAMHYTKPCIVAAFTDGKIFEYDLEEMRFTYSVNEYFVPKMYLNRIQGIILDPRNENILILYNDAFLFVLEKVEKLKKNHHSPNDSKIAKYEKEETMNNSSEEDKCVRLQAKFKKTYEHLVHLSWLSESELVIVGVNPVTLVEQLPAPFRKKTFGAD